MSSSLREIACHHAGLSGETIIQQTSSPCGNMNRSRLWWSIPLECMTPLSGNQDLRVSLKDDGPTGQTMGQRGSDLSAYRVSITGYYNIL